MNKKQIINILATSFVLIVLIFQNESRRNEIASLRFELDKTTETIGYLISTAGLQTRLNRVFTDHMLAQPLHTNTPVNPAPVEP